MAKFLDEESFNKFRRETSLENLNSAFKGASQDLVEELLKGVITDISIRIKHSHVKEIAARLRGFQTLNHSVAHEKNKAIEHELWKKEFAESFKTERIEKKKLMNKMLRRNPKMAVN